MSEALLFSLRSASLLKSLVREDPQMPRKKTESHGRRGHATLAAHGVEHYRRMRALSLLNRSPKPSVALTRLDVYLRDDQLAFIARLVAASGMSKAALLREAIDCYWGEWERAKEEARKHRSLMPFVRGSNIDRGRAEPEPEDE